MEKEKLNYSTYFSSSIYYKEDISWLKEINKFSNKHMKNLVIVDHSSVLIKDKIFFDFSDYIIALAYEILNHQGYDLKKFALKISEMLVQEFTEKESESHDLHAHWNGHISGFYFLKCSDKTPYPIFHDPRNGKKMIQLPEKNSKDVTEASEKINYKPVPGSLILFNSFIPHEFIVDNGLNPFRFIHFNIQAFPINLLK